ncbi:MAG: DNA recombination protein RmuC [Bacteroidales bacterium]|nr:DNA recombination protein RmuC [Bacteroidales bacterium]
MEFVFFGTGLIVASLVFWIYYRFKSSSGQQLLSEKNKFLLQQVEELKTRLTEKENLLLQLNSQNSAKETEIKNLVLRLQEQKQELSEIREKFNAEFKNLANEILEEKSKKFTEQNKTNLDVILKPLHDRIKEFEKKVEETYDKEAQQRFSLKEEVKRLAELNQQISKEASSLTKALKGDSKTQGNWGEVILENILERSGLRKGQEYTVQDSFNLDGNKRSQSDVIVHYPGERSIVIDSKVTLTAYDKYMSASDEKEKEDALKAHLISVKNHINDLASKNYQDIDEIKTLDFIILFMPVEPAYLLAIKNEPQLWTYAYERRILLISPTNLIAVLKMIESLWKQEYQNRNVLEIARQGGSLYDDFVRLSENLLKLGKKMDDASQHYKETMKKISEGRGNLIGRVEKLKALGVKVKKSLPNSLLHKALNNDEEKQEEN